MLVLGSILVFETGDFYTVVSESKAKATPNGRSLTPAKALLTHIFSPLLLI